jgi:phospholipase C
MRKPVFLVVFSILLTCGVGLTILNSCGGSSSGQGGGGGGGGGGGTQVGKIGHIVVIVQENRTPDNLFQDPVLIGRGADIVQSGMNSHGQTVPLAPVLLTSGFDLEHDHGAFYLMYDNGKMDGADRVSSVCLPHQTCPPSPPFSYVQPSEVQPYFQLAEQYTFGDRMFQTNQGPSFPAHQFLISGTSAPTATSNLFAAGNPNIGPAGCIAPPTEFVLVADPSGKLSSRMYPCFEHPTLTDLLNAAKVSWKYYAPSAGSIWTGPDAIQHMCQPQTVSGTLTCTGSDWNNVIIPSQQVLTDIANHQLAQVNWVIPTGQESDHPTQNDGSGPSWVASVVNAVGNSSYWSDTAIFICWDDWGGFYDHVAPKVISDGTSWGSGYVYGFRVPLIVVSPYAKAAYISHATHDFGSILKFIEETYSLKSLNYADAPADDFADCFDFTQKPLQFHVVGAPLKADFFINDKRPPTDPDTD